MRGFIGNQLVIDPVNLLSNRQCRRITESNQPAVN